MGCARCHNHKYDPIPQRDYYRLGAILQTAYDPYDWLIPTADNPANLKYSSRHLDIALASERQDTAKFNAPIEAEIKRLEAVSGGQSEASSRTIAGGKTGSVSGLREGGPEDNRRHSGRKANRAAEASGGKISGHFEDHA